MSRRPKIQVGDWVTVCEPKLNKHRKFNYETQDYDVIEEHYVRRDFHEVTAIDHHGIWLTDFGYGAHYLLSEIGGINAVVMIDRPDKTKNMITIWQKKEEESA